MSGRDIDLDEMGPVGELTGEQCTAALRTVCAYSQDATEALGFAQMLGLAPAPVGVRLCPTCGRPISRAPKPGHVTRGAYGLCSGCATAMRRLRDKEEG